MRKEGIELFIRSATLVSILFWQCLGVQGSPLEGDIQTPAISAPALGFVFDSASKKINPVMGIPGAALLGEALALPPLASATIAPRQDYALVSTATGAVCVLNLKTLEIKDIPGAIPASRTFVSPTGSAAALYLADTGAVQILTGLPDAPVIEREFSFAGLGADLGALAVADDGRLILATFTDQQTVMALGTGGTREVAVSGVMSAIAFRPATHDALLTSIADDQVWLIRDVDGRAEYQMLASHNDGISEPVAADFSPDGTRALVANSQGTLVSVDLTGGPAVQAVCGHRITGLQRLAGVFLLGLNVPGEKTIYLVDASAAQPRVFFVPPELEPAVTLLAPQSRRLTHAN
jgi:hypothetical protein